MICKVSLYENLLSSHETFCKTVFSFEKLYFTEHENTRFSVIWQYAELSLLGSKVKGTNLLNEKFNKGSV